MTTVSEAFDVIRERIEANPPSIDGSPVPLYWQNEDGPPLPDTPAPFVYVLFVTDPGVLAAFGGGRGANLYRNPGRIDIFAFVPRGTGMKPALDLAEQVAALFRSYRDEDISCFEATVYPLGSGNDLKPPGLDSEVSNYYAAAAEIGLHFDLVG